MVTPPDSYASRDACLVNVVYSDKLTEEQNQMLARFEARTHHRPCFIHEFEKGLFTAQMLWEANVGMAQTIANDVRSLDFPPSVKPHTA